VINVHLDVDLRDTQQLTLAECASLARTSVVTGTEAASKVIARPPRMNSLALTPVAPAKKTCRLMRSTRKCFAVTFIARC